MVSKDIYVLVIVHIYFAFLAGQLQAALRDEERGERSLRVRDSVAVRYGRRSGYDRNEPLFFGRSRNRLRAAKGGTQ